MKMKAVAAVSVMLAFVMLGLSVRGDDAKPPGDIVPAVDTREVERRGSMVVRAGCGPMKDEDILLTSAMGPPVDDSHKWFVTVITQKNCPPCDKLLADIGAGKMRAWVDARDAKQSWAHFNVYDLNDATQKHRWEKIRVRGTPTIIVQPPRNGDFGKPSNVVFQQTGYQDSEALTVGMRDAMLAYVRKLQREGAVDVHREDLKPEAKDAQPQPQTKPDEGEPNPFAGFGQESSKGIGQVGVNPPFAPAGPVAIPSGPLVDFTIQPQPQQQPQQQQQQPALSSLLAAALSGTLGASGFHGFLLLVVAAMSTIRTVRTLQGKPLVMSDETFKIVTGVLQTLGGGGTPGQPTKPTA